MTIKKYNSFGRAFPKRSKGFGMGWHYQGYEHGLAARGIRTKRYGLNFIGNVLQKDDYAAFEKPQQSPVIKSVVAPLPVSGLKDFLHKHFGAAVSQQPEHIRESKSVQNAQAEIEHITNWQKFRQWSVKHKPALVLIGMGGLFGFVGLAAGVPTVMQDSATGEIVSVGGTLLGRAGMISQTIFTGAGALAEARIIEHDIAEKYHKKLLVDPNKIRVEQNAVVFKLNPKAISYMRLSEHDSEPESYGDLAKMSSHSIPISGLTPVERKNLYTAMRKVKHLFHSMGKDVDFNASNFQVVKRVGPDDSAWGGHQGQLIQIDRDILLNPDKTEGVMTHEMVHRVYNVRDETRDLENIDIDIIGKLL